MFSPWFKFCNFSLTAERHIAAKNQSPKWTSWLLDTAWKRFFFMWFILIQKDSFRQYLGSHTVYIGFAKTCPRTAYENLRKFTKIGDPAIYT